MLDELGEMHLSSGEPLNRETLLAELDRVRRQGYSVSYGERMVGTRGRGGSGYRCRRGDDCRRFGGRCNGQVDGEEDRVLTGEVRDAAKAIAERYDGALRSK